MAVSRLLRGHHEFQKRFASSHAHYERLVTQGQHPHTLWIGCSDSRVVPEHIVGAEAGELFVLRTVANIVPAAEFDDGTASAVLEYAVHHLHIGDLVVCGHSDCGGIRALVAGVDANRDPGIARWLEHARAALPLQAETQARPDDIHLAAVRNNVLLQHEHLMSHACVREAVGAGKLRLHGWLYDLASGDLTFYDARTQAWSGAH